MGRLQEHIVQVEKENDRVRQENQRLAHVIDSGDWGRKRIAELLQAGQVLSAERDALTRLLGRMQRQHGFALNQQKVHQEEVNELKEQILRNVLCSKDSYSLLGCLCKRNNSFLCELNLLSFGMRRYAHSRVDHSVTQYMYV